MGKLILELWDTLKFATFYPVKRSINERRIFANLQIPRYWVLREYSQNLAYSSSQIITTFK